MKLLSGLLPALLLTSPIAAQAKAPPGALPKAKITWKKTVIDKAFRSEGVAVADFNKDGKMDIFVGDVWYEAPDWKVHQVRPGKPYDPKGYSEAFACFADDFNGDGYPDVIVIPFPGKECYWYENPGAKGDKWLPHLLTTSACNETPIYVDLFGTGKRVLVMGWQPPGQSNMGQMCYFLPGKDPTKPWQRLPISEPSQKGKEIPGTQRFSHGLGHGDVNGDGRVDIIITNGWWEQPAKVDGVTPWKFHPADLGPACADMFTYDIDGDGKADIISSSAHNYGLWWHQQKSGADGPTFVRRDLFKPPAEVAQLPRDNKLSPDELAVYNAINKRRNTEGKAPWKADAGLCDYAHAYAVTMGKGLRDANNKGEIPRSSGATVGATRSRLGAPKYKGLLSVSFGRFHTIDAKFDAKAFVASLSKPHLSGSPALEVGIGVVRKANGDYSYAIVLGDSGAFSLPAQTHALHCVDINGDGLKDLVTGRRWWAHGPHGDSDPSDPAYLYWFEAKRDKSGMVRFIPHQIDDDSGIGTQFAVQDMNGDGLPDVIISNKKGVFLFVQERGVGKE